MPQNTTPQTSPSHPPTQLATPQQDPPPTSPARRAENSSAHHTRADEFSSSLCCGAWGVEKSTREHSCAKTPPPKHPPVIHPPNSRPRHPPPRPAALKIHRRTTHAPMNSQAACAVGRGGSRKAHVSIRAPKHHPPNIPQSSTHPTRDPTTRPATHLPGPPR